MSVPNSVEELIQLIRKSGMVDEGRLTNYLQRREFARGLPTDPREFAEDMVRDGVLTNFQAEQFLLGKWRGFTIGKYKLLERVGVGGMGQVFLCEHMFMKKRVAVKVLPPAKADQPAALGRFYREARAAGSLQHPNIVRTHDIDQDGNLHFLVMDYVDGTNLLDVVKKHGPMDLGRAASYIRQVALALDNAFRAGIIHRDIKPGNVLIDRRGTAKLLDMGLARFFKDHTDQLTVKYDDKIVLGTADYVAPEQVANSHAVDIRADIYGLGATYYFLLAGHPPFPSGTVSQKLLWHRTKEPTPIREIRPDVPDEVAAILARMMAKDPKARYQTPAQVAAELEAVVPAVVPLPAEEEMPVLSPAATEGAESEADVETPQPVGVSAEPVARAASGVVGAGATVRSPFGAPAAVPFGPAPAASNPWSPSARSGSGVRPGLPPRLPTVHPAGETVSARAEQTPAGKRPAGSAHPFRADVTEPTPKKKPWGVILAAVGGAAVAGAAAVLMKVLG
ncbi:MAG TPA: protein kinase [Urbifossiella sp.]|nr:protein kinase [Urbifossiella sp.]